MRSIHPEETVTLSLDLVFIPLDPVHVNDVRVMIAVKLLLLSIRLLTTRYPLAVIQGHLNKEYSDLVLNIKSVLFLATPHRGTDLAKTLNRVLSGSVFGHAPREYITELTRNSPTIDELSDSFRHHASKLHIFSFYETIATRIGLLNILILEKQSSLLGYENETVKPLNANHHEVCKFIDPADSNYKSVRDALRNTINTLRSPVAKEDGDQEELDTLQAWLGGSLAQDSEMSSLRSIRTPGTCEDLVKVPEFESWLASDRPHILWAYAPAGSGKSVQCSFVIDFLKNKYKCVYWFFKYGDVGKQGLANMFRSAIYQIATQDTAFSRSLAKLAKSGKQVAQADATTVWQTILAPKLSALNCDLFWVIDAVDESDSIQSLVNFLANIGQTGSRIHVLIFGRPLPSITQSLKRARRRINITEINVSDNLKDIRLTASDEMEALPASNEFKQFIIDEIATRSRGSFLWTGLVLKRILQCLREEDVRQVLQDTPNGMESFFDRMAEAIARIDRNNDRQLSRILLSWATYSVRPISIDELKSQYATELNALDLDHLVSKICGEFATIGHSNQLILVHHTAREYLRSTDKFRFSLKPAEANRELLAVCLESLNSLSPNQISQRDTSKFVTYSSMFWYHHLDQCSVKCDQVLELLFTFFDGDSPPLWIHALAINGQLSTLLNVSSSLINFVKKKRKVTTAESSSPELRTQLSLLERWAVDLLRITTKFGSYLSQKPETIHTCIPPLSPRNSVIFQKFAKKAAATISVSGLSNMDWDDCVAKVGSGTGNALHMAVSSDLFAVAENIPVGRTSIGLWNSVIFQERPRFTVDEPICAITLSRKGSLLACYGLHHTLVWDLVSGTTVIKVASPHRERAMAFEFSADESFIIAATDLRRIYKLSLEPERPSWTRFNPSLLQEHFVPEGAFVNSPSSLAFNNDCSRLAVAYRSFPLTIWSLTPPEPVARCTWKQKQGDREKLAWTGVSKVVWHPFNGEVLGVYRDQRIFKWGPNDNTHIEVPCEHGSAPSEIRCSPNGAVYATRDSLGTIRIYDYSQMMLIHEIKSGELPRSMGFSPDSRRVYDLQPSYCNVWEPSCLLKTAETGLAEDCESMHNPAIGDEENSVPEPQLHRTEEERAQLEGAVAIKTLATCSANRHLCAYVTSPTTVVVYDLRRDIKHTIERTENPSWLGDSLCLSRTGDRIVYFENYGRVQVKDIDISSEDGEMKTTAIYTGPKKLYDVGLVKQVLLNDTSEYLVMAGPEKGCIICIADGSVLGSVEYEAEEQTWWQNDLKDPYTVLAFTAKKVRAYSWNSLDLKYTMNLEATDNASDDSARARSGTTAIEFLLPSYYPNIQVAVTSQTGSNYTRHDFLLVDMSVLNRSPCLETVVRILDISPELARQIDQPLGILEDGRLVFLDGDLWVCSVSLLPGARTRRLKRHFFLPRDWLIDHGKLLCRVQIDGTLLCPSKGGVMVVRNDIRLEW